MKASHLRTLEALFSHPLQHGIRSHDVESLLISLGATVELLEKHRLKVTWPTGDFVWVSLGVHSHPCELGPDAVLTIRRFLESAGHAPCQPEAPKTSLLDDHTRYLVLHLSHQVTEVFQLSGASTQHSTLKPVGLWATHQSLHNRRERDLSGQTTPVDHDYLHQLVQAIQQADSVLLLGHGHGESDMRHVLLKHLTTHHPELIDRIVDQATVESHSLTEAELMAIAFVHFGRQPLRHLPLTH